MLEQGTELMRRATAEELVAQRNSALALYGDAHAALVLASAAVVEAGKAAHTASPGVNRYNHHLDKEKCHFHNALSLPVLDDYLHTARRIVDTDVWAYIIQLTDLERLMDKTAKDQFNQQLLTDPPEVTVDNVFATLQQFAADSGTIFKRGIAECFSKLDRRFRSHDGWKIGSRIILTYAFNEWGSWNYNRNHRDTMMDVERVFRILDNNPSSTCEIVNRMEDARRGGSGRRQSEIRTEYFTVRAFMNGNAHIWFKRDDLLDKVNRLLGEYYGAPIPEEKEPDRTAGDLYNAKHTPAKLYGFFPTPDTAAKDILRDVPLYQDRAEPPLTILEPSAGTGNLALLCAGGGPDVDVWARERYRFDNQVDCVEIQPHLADALRARRKFRKVYTADFLSLQPSTTGLYDRVVMNPPFDRERDIDHVLHALKFLKPDGLLVAIMSAGTEFRETRKTIAFRELMGSMNANWRDLPAGSFSSVGTNCNTLVLKVWKNGRHA